MIYHFNHSRNFDYKYKIMKKFLEIYFCFFIGLPIILCVIIYLIGCFISWSFLSVNIQWGVIRVYIIISIIFAFFLSIDK